MKRFLLFLSKTDRDVLSHCPLGAKYNQIALGLFVLLTGLLAFFSASFAVSSLFRESATTNVSLVGSIISPMIGSLYAIMIMAIDREIVSASNKLATIIRIPLALIIGVVIAVPLELKLLEENINEAIANEARTESMARKYTEVDSVRNTFTSQEQLLLSSKKDLLDQAAFWSEKMVSELVGEPGNNLTGKGGKGPAYYENREKRDEFLKRADDINDEILLLRGRMDNVLSDLKGNYEKVEPNYDFLTQYRKLHEMQEDDLAVYQMSWGITLLLVFLELIPALTKLLSKTSEYDALYEARRRLNIQHTHRAINTEMRTLEDLSDSDVRQDLYKKEMEDAYRSLKNSILK